MIQIRPISQRLLFAALIGVLLVSALTRLGYASLAIRPDAEPQDIESEAHFLLCPPSDEVGNLLEQIAIREATLDKRENDILLREQNVLTAREEALSALGRLEDAEERLAERMAQSSQAAANDVAQLVTVYEGMKPKDAAALFETMEPPFAAGFLSRMRPDAASAIFSNLSPDAAYALSVLIAGRNANAATE